MLASPAADDRRHNYRREKVFTIRRRTFNLVMNTVERYCIAVIVEI